MRDSIFRKVDKVVNRGEDITVYLPGAKIEDVADKAGQVMGGGTGGAVLVHVATNNAEKERIWAIVGKYKRMVKTLKEALQEDGYQHTSAEGMYGGGSRLRRHVVKLCGKR